MPAPGVGLHTATFAHLPALELEQALRDSPFETCFDEDDEEIFRPIK